MEYRLLGTTDLKVSVICLGTMTWGEQNTQEEAFEQMDYALEQGVNFFDAAELYPVPPKKDTYGETERIIGAWFNTSKKRDDIILATKVTGRSGMEWIRGGPRLNETHITQAVEGSLKRLQTDYIDLYQIHWPERSANYFGRLDYKHQEDPSAIPIQEQLHALQKLQKEGKIRHIGISNETPWGMMEFLTLAKEHNLPRAMSIQNPYSLVNRSFEVGLAEMAIREKCGLLAYSPLGFGVLSGKYAGGKKPEGARLTLFGDIFTRYLNERSRQATDDYVALAQKHKLDPAQMALAFINQQAFVTSNIIGATSMAQLKDNIASIDLKLDNAILEAIDNIHQDNPNPAP